MSKKKIILFFVFIGHIAFSQIVTKNDTGSSISINKLLSEVVVTGQINPINQKNAIQNIKIIGAKELKSGLYNNLAEALSQKLNIQLIQDNVLGSGLKMQGLAGQNVKILIDEIPVIGRLNGNIDLSQINLENIERIEIVEGPLSVNYGTDALAGTINIITKKNYTLKKNLAFKSYYESIGRYNNSFS
ncbi:MAG: TonB-dependent receptor, partial [Flavobacteriales bacterium]|nr:TonB-dependent receptor [Flavobacteriales bacterium]